MLSLDPHNGFVYQVGPLSLSPSPRLSLLPVRPFDCPTVLISRLFRTLLGHNNAQLSRPDPVTVFKGSCDVRPRERHLA